MTKKLYLSFYFKLYLDMQNKYLNLFLSTVLLFVACKKEDKQDGGHNVSTNVETSSTQVAQKQMYRAMVDDLRIRESADLNGKVLEKVPFGTMFDDMKEKSAAEVEVELQGEKKKGYWVKIRTANGKTGWVHSAAVELISVVPRYQVAADADKVSVEKYTDFLAKLSPNEPESFGKALAEYDVVFKTANPSTCEWGYTKLMEFGAKIEDKSWAWKEMEKLSSTAEYEKIYDTVKKCFKMDYNPYTKRLAAAGLIIDNAEGSFWAMPSPDVVETHVLAKVSPMMKTYLGQYKKEILNRSAEDNGLIISCQEAAERMIFWENFAQNNPTFLLKNEAENNFIEYLNTLMYGLNNTPAYEYETNKLTAEYENAYKWLFKNHAKSKGTAAIQEVYTFYQQNKGIKQAALVKKQNEVMTKYPYLNFE